VGSHVREETDLCGTSSATDVTDEVAGGRESGARLCRSVLLLSTLFYCVVETGILKALDTPVKQADRHFDLLLAKSSQVFGSTPVDFMLAFMLSLYGNAAVDGHEAWSRIAVLRRM